MSNQEKIQIHYIKSPHFKSFFATGIFGGVSPNGLVSMAFFVDRPPIPQSIVTSVDVETGKTKEIDGSRVVKEGVIREVDCNILLDLNTAISLRDWLDKQIANLRSIESKQERK